MLDNERSELRAFLRSRRRRIRPETVGMPVRSHRRAQGLTRDEVAELAGVSVGWYAQLELGRPINISAKSLEAIAGALQLDRYETEYLFSVAGMPRATEAPAPPDRIPAELRYIVDHYTPSTAQILSRRFDVLYLNRSARLLFNHSDSGGVEQYNMIYRLFMDPERRVLFQSWEEFARTMTAAFRHSYANAVGDPWFEELLAKLQAESPEFVRFWNEYEVAPAMWQRIAINVRSDVAYMVWSVLPVPESNGLLLAFTVPADPQSESILRDYVKTH